jgi:hypothetical protein
MNLSFHLFRTEALLLGIQGWRARAQRLKWSCSSFKVYNDLIGTYILTWANSLSYGFTHKFMIGYYRIWRILVVENNEEVHENQIK